MKRRFIQCDVFSTTATKGNGLAVVVDAEGLSDIQMQEFASWTNLAETTFLLPPEDPGADYKVRIFTPTREMLFAGHPTLGSCASWLYCGGKPRHPGKVKQECRVGIVEIELGGEVPAFVAPPTKIDVLPEDSLQHISQALKLDPSQVVSSALLDHGPVWQVLELDNAEQVLAVDSSLISWPESKPVGLIGRYPAGAECQFEVRMLAPSSGMSEDPITGSLNSALAHWLLSMGRLKESVVVAQGTVIGRVGRVYIRPVLNTPGKVLIGGHTNILIEGHLDL